uniref:Coiled-coil domain containing 50 n=1 Tax=Canis lupus familiaris TaxID=9615 RepID=A0A8P0NW80_CANLF
MPETQPGSRKSQPRNQSPGGEADSVLGDPRALVEAFRSPRTGRRRGPGRGLSAAAATGRPSAQRRWRGGGRRADLGTPAARRPGYRPAAPGARRPSYRPAPPGLAGPVTDPHPWGSQAQLQTRSPRGSQARLQTRSPRGSQARLQTRSPLGLAGQVTDPQPPGLPGAVTDPQPPGAPRRGYRPAAPGAPRRGYRPAAPGAPRRGYRPAAPRGSQARLQTRSPRGSQARLQTRSPPPPRLAGPVTDPQPPGARRPSYRPAAPGAPRRGYRPAAPGAPRRGYRPAAPSWSQAGYRPAPPLPGARRRGYRPAAPIWSQARLQARPAPPRPRARPARPPFCLLCPSVRDGPAPLPGSEIGYRSGRGAGGAGAGGCGGLSGAACPGARTALPPPLSPALPRRPLLPQVGARCRPDFAPRRALLLLLGLRGCGAAGLRGCGAAGLRGCGAALGAGGEGRAARGGRDPGPTWLKSPSTSPSCPESRKKVISIRIICEYLLKRSVQISCSAQVLIVVVITPILVCRDFAVLEDHTLAHSLQEQEIEHHLASNIQRNRLVQHDLQVAKQLQEEDLKAQAQLQKRYKDLEQQDCEIAQEIQEKLAIEAERRRIQEKKDEDIARLLQEKELQEEKKRKKHFPESSGSSAYGDSCYYENGDQPQSRRARELGSGVSRSCRLQSDGNIVKQRNKKLKHPVENLEELEDHCSSGKFLSSRSLGTLRANPQIDIEQRERKRSDHERRRRPPLPKISGEVFLSTGFDDGEAHSSHRTWNWEKQSRHQDRLSPKSSQKAGLHCKEAVYGRDNGQGEHRERKHRPRTPPFPGSEEQLQLHDTGMKPRMMKEADSAPSRVAHRDQEWYDAEIARKLQEEEILATQVDMRAAQVAQDEEIARLLMAEEKKAYKKAKEREKSSLDKRKHDSDWKPKTTKSAHSKSKESNDPHRSKNDRPARPPPPTMTEAEDLDYTHFTNQHNSTRHFSKSESSHKGFHHKQ